MFHILLIFIAIIDYSLSQYLVEVVSNYSVSFIDNICSLNGRHLVDIVQLFDVMQLVPILAKTYRSLVQLHLAVHILPHHQLHVPMFGYVLLFM